jgi:hypothetical protein
MATWFTVGCDATISSHQIPETTDTHLSERDTQAPVITLRGSPEVTVAVGEMFTDDGATAYDEHDGNITNKLSVVSDLNLSRAGTYHIRYNVSDAAGNAAEEVVRIVRVVYRYGTLRPEVTVEISTYSEDNLSVVYHPSTWSTRPTPVVFFGTGWAITDHTSYQTLLSFVANHGYSVVYVPDQGSYFSQLDKFIDIVTEFSDYLDTSRIGVLGHSSGGGITFMILKRMIEEGYGENGRFLCALDPYFAQYMDKSDMQLLAHTNVLFIQFSPDGNNDGSETDPRIPLTEYYLLTGEGIDKNYTVLRGLGNNSHGYPTRSKIENMQELLRPLDALMEYSFVDPTPQHHAMALEGEGKNDPYQNQYQVVLDSDEYEYSCQYANRWHKGSNGESNSTIDNCGEPPIASN